MEYPKYKVFVKCFTYNQSEYIEETMNGFIKQQTNFPFICCIVDDASTDGEQQVIIEYIKENFDISDAAVAYQKETDYAHVIYVQHKVNKNCFFAVLLLKENHYSLGKSKIEYLKEWNRGVSYEAICEGDDYWIIHDKLQMQVDFLDNNLDCGLIYGRVESYIQSSGKKGKIIGADAQDFMGIIKKNTIPTLSVMYRSCYDDRYWALVKGKTWRMTDKALWLLIAIDSKIHFDNRTVGVYRVLENSATSRSSWEKRLLFINDSFNLNRYFLNRYAPNEIEANEDRRYRALLVNNFEFKRFVNSFQMFKKIRHKKIKDYVLLFVIQVMKCIR